MTITKLTLNTGPVEVNQQRPTINDLMLAINASFAEIDAEVAPLTNSGATIVSSTSKALFADLTIGTDASAVAGTVVTDDGWLKIEVNGTERYIGLGATYA